LTCRKDILLNAETYMFGRFVSNENCCGRI